MPPQAFPLVPRFIVSLLPSVLILRLHETRGIGRFAAARDAMLP